MAAREWPPPSALPWQNGGFGSPTTCRHVAFIDPHADVGNRRWSATRPSALACRQENANTLIVANVSGWLSGKSDRQTYTAGLRVRSPPTASACFGRKQCRQTPAHVCCTPARRIALTCPALPTFANATARAAAHGRRRSGLFAAVGAVQAAARTHTEVAILPIK